MAAPAPDQQDGAGGAGGGAGAPVRRIVEVPALPYRPLRVPRADGQGYRTAYPIIQFAHFRRGYDSAIRDLHGFEHLEPENWSDPSLDYERNVGYLKSYVTYWFAHTVEVHLRDRRAEHLRQLATSLSEDAQREAAGLLNAWDRLKRVQYYIRNEQVVEYWRVCHGISELLSREQPEDMEMDPFRDSDFMFFGRGAEDRDVRYMAIHMKLRQDLAKSLNPIYAFFKRRDDEAPKLHDDLSSGPMWDFLGWNTRDGAYRQGFANITGPTG